MSKSVRVMKRLIAFESMLERIALYIGVTALAAMMFLVSLDVLSRYIFNKPLLFTFDAVALLMVILTSLVIAYVQSRRGHINVDFLLVKLSPKIRLIIDICSLLIGLLFFLAVAYSSGFLAWDSWEKKEFSEGIIALPLYPGRFALFAGIGLMCIRLIIDLVHQITVLAGTKEPLESKQPEEIVI